jgi:hypothetical protein
VRIALADADEEQNVEHPSTFGHTEEAGPFDTLGKVLDFEQSLDKKKGGSKN